MIVNRDKLRAIEKTAGVQSTQGNKVTKFLTAVSEIESAVRGTEAAVGCGDVTMRYGTAEAGAGSDHNHETGFATVFGGRRTFDHLHRLHGFDGELIRKYLALLVRDGLVVDRK